MIAPASPQLMMLVRPRLAMSQATTLWHLQEGRLQTMLGREGRVGPTADRAREGLPGRALLWADGGLFLVGGTQSVLSGLQGVWPV